MNISDIKFNIQNNVSPSAARPVSGENTNDSANAQITLLSKGEVFKGQILDIKDNQVVISMNGKNLFAHMSEAMNLNIGDELSFLIKENTGNSVTIKPFANSVESMKDSTIFKILDVNNFSPTEKNYQIAETLMKNNMPVDKAGMQKIMQQTYRFPHANIDTLVELNKLGIEVNESSISQYEDFVSNNLKVMNSVTTLTNDFGELSADLFIQADGNVAGILDISNNLLGLISDKSDLANILINNVDGSQNEQMNIENIQGELAANDEVQYGIIDISDKIEGLKESVKLDGNLIDSLFRDLSHAGISNEMLGKIIENSKSPVQLLNNINSVINSQINSLDQELIAAFFSSELYKNTLTESLKRKLSLDGNNMKDPKELNDLYKNIYDKTDKLLNAFSRDSSELSGNMSNSANNLRQQLDFVQNMNNMYAYAQIPVNISGNDTNSELFVYMNKKNIKETKDKVSALLHLDMEHLGATDVHVSLSNNIVHTRFHVEDEESARIIDENMKLLEKAINDFGYSLTNEVITKETKPGSSKNMIVDEIAGNDLEQSVKRYSFDVRM